MRSKELPPIGQGCEPMFVKVGIYHKREFCYCKKHSNLELNKCVVCGEYFHTQRKQTKTCGDRCRKRLSRMKKQKRVVVIITKAGRVEQEVFW